jgi:2-polyprenyl-3-methyl-5-hydroxy-6-metoxy-1,4-benzoquinol methylase
VSEQSVPTKLQHTEESFFTSRDKCPVCDASGLETLYERSYDDPFFQRYMVLAYGESIEYNYLNGMVYRLCKCSQCKFVFQQEVLNDHGLSKLYDEWIDADDALRWHLQSVENNFLVYSQRIRFVARCLGSSSIEVLDWGAGFGQFCAIAAAYGMHVSALDLSAKRAEFISKLGIECVSMGNLPKEKFHFVNLDQVLEHVSDPLNVLRNVHAALRPEGILFASSPNARSVEQTLSSLDTLSVEKYQAALLDASALQHINCFTNATLRTICDKAGFKELFRPLVFVGSSNVGTSVKEMVKNLVRPLYYHLNTSLFFVKAS